MNSPTLEDAIIFATTAHAGQKDKGGTTYILHPLRVMLSLTTEEERITAVLHDTIEDCGVTLGQLRSLGYSEDIVQALDALSRRTDEHYADFIQRIRAASPLARRVKIADLQDNLGRCLKIVSPDEVARARIKKYQDALAELESAHTPPSTQ